MGWSVTVTRDGEDVLTISDQDIFGKELTADDTALIRSCAEHLLAFVGPVDPEPFILPDEPAADAAGVECGDDDRR